MGRGFAHLFGLHPGVDTLALADPDVEALQETRRDADVLHAVESMDQLLELDVDSIGVYTPPWTHAELAIRALNAGKNVISACPAAVTMDEMRDLLEAVERTGRIYMLCETSYYYPCTIYCRERYNTTTVRTPTHSGCAMTTGTCRQCSTQPTRSHL